MISPLPVPLQEKTWKRHFMEEEANLIKPEEDEKVLQKNNTYWTENNRLFACLLTGHCSRSAESNMRDSTPPGSYLFQQLPTARHYSSISSRTDFILGPTDIWSLWYAENSQCIAFLHSMLSDFSVWFCACVWVSDCVWMCYMRELEPLGITVQFHCTVTRKMNK